MRAREFIYEFGAPTGTVGKPSMSTPGSQPKPLSVGTNNNNNDDDDQDDNQVQNGTNATGTVGTRGPSMSNDPLNSTAQTSTNPNATSPKPNVPNQNTMNSKHQSAMQMAQQLGLNPQQAQTFAQKVLGTGTIGQEIPGQHNVSPQDMQKALPKPGSNVNLQKFGQTKVLPTPGDEKGIKLDTTNQLGYPVMVDPRDLQKK